MVFDTHFADAVPDDVDAWGFAVLDELVGLDGVIDADLTADIARRRVWYDFLVDAVDATDALSLGAAAFRTALHAAGIATGGMDLRVGVHDTRRDAVDA